MKPQQFPLRNLAWLAVGVCIALLTAPQPLHARMGVVKLVNSEKHEGDIDEKDPPLRHRQPRRSLCEARGRGGGDPSRSGQVGQLNTGPSPTDSARSKQAW